MDASYSVGVSDATSLRSSAAVGCRRKSCRLSTSPSIANAKTLEAVDKVASYVKAKTAKNPPEPKEPKGPRVRSDDGRFVGVRVNEEEVPRLPIFMPSLGCGQMHRDVSEKRGSYRSAIMLIHRPENADSAS